MIEDLASRIATRLHSISGSVFYSGRNAFKATAPLYLLGINPGGSPRSQAAETVGWHTRKVLKSEPDDWSAYRDESWGNAIPGTHPMQRRVLHLVERLEMNPGDVPASNVVFVRSQREATLASSFRELADMCWPFHEAALKQLKPRVVVCFGATAGNYVGAKLQATTLVEEFVEQNRRQWRSRSFCSASGIGVVVVTHPSIANWCKPETDPSGLVTAAISR